MTKHLSLNFVHNDEIWKDHVGREMLSFTHKWPETWSFLIREYKGMNNLLHGLPTPPPTPPKSQSSAVPTLPPIYPQIPEQERTHSPFPQQTAQLIGWKSTKPAWQLEKYGRYAPNSRGQQGIFKLLNWPHEGM